MFLCLNCGIKNYSGVECYYCKKDKLIKVHYNKITPDGKDPKSHHEQVKRRVYDHLLAFALHHNEPDVYPMPEPLVLDVIDFVYINRHYHIWWLYAHKSTLEQLNVKIASTSEMTTDD